MLVADILALCTESSTQLTLSESNELICGELQRYAAYINQQHIDAHEVIVASCFAHQLFPVDSGERLGDHRDCTV